MTPEFDYSPEPARAVAASESDKWQNLCHKFLPVASESSIWRSSRTRIAGDLDQGWKLHLSATILTANKVFEAVASYLNRRGALFKAPCSLQELSKINSGLYYGYCQVGKFVTIYPRSSNEAVSLARRLHHLTRQMSGPVVPFDSRFRSDSSVYYRYGSFVPLEIKNDDGSRIQALRDNEGKLVPDARYSAIPKPDWIIDPFVEKRRRIRFDSCNSPLQTTFRAFQALAQRGKGGVYKALDFSLDPPRLCILKEGRRNGEIAWDGRDGFWRIKREEQVLNSLRTHGIPAPAVYSSFEAEGNYYLVTELIEGQSLQELLSNRRTRLPISRVLKYGIELSSLLSRIHSAGWVWRDCKPTNIVVTPDDSLRPLDFEGASAMDRPDPFMWSTPAFVSSADRTGFFGKDDDLYALGVVIHFLLVGRLFAASDAVPLEKLNHKTPVGVNDLVGELLTPKRRGRPEAAEVWERLSSTLVALKRGNSMDHRSHARAGASRCRDIEYS